MKENKEKDGGPLALLPAPKPKTFLVAVYGSLRQGMSNHRVMGPDPTLLGTFETQPEYTMYSVSGYFPALVEGGHTSITMEVYELDEKAFEAVNNLEGFISEGHEHNHYDRKLMWTPFGNAYGYLYNLDPGGLYPVLSGDWVKFKETDNLVNKDCEC